MTYEAKLHDELVPVDDWFDEVVELFELVEFDALVEFEFELFELVLLPVVDAFELELTLEVEVVVVVVVVEPELVVLDELLFELVEFDPLWFEPELDASPSVSPPSPLGLVLLLPQPVMTARASAATR